MTKQNNRTSWSTNRLTLEERKKIRKMLDQGYNYRAISDIISRGFSTVVREVSRGGGKDKYNPDKEHELAGERHANMGNRIKTKQITTEKSGQLCNEDMENRLRNLEMQVEILAETCKRLVRKIE